MNELAVEAVDPAARGAAQFGRAASDRVQDGLHFGWRAAYRRQDLAGRRLMFQRLRQVSRLRLHLVEQPRVLNGDDRLIRESLEQLDLTFREGPRFAAAKSDTSARPALAPTGH